ncbi:hypothetical protein NDU88_003418 [Pleurodeles waltl]|uniref:Uncharacterized protein n=1 Tax=Pleurodeles waltl TaxID=8319 RepID=A0AAV7QCW4_PLEWA|nr:hypothetical protein NDU88_003418 [Pleurodeles waltl]
MQRQPRPTLLPLSVSKPSDSAGPTLTSSANFFSRSRSISGKKAGGTIHGERLLLSRSTLCTLPASKVGEARRPSAT